MTEAEILFTEILDCERAALYLDKGKKLDKAGALRVSSALKRRIAGEPLAYILGEVEFMGFKFKVTKDVLIPRPDTEILVETAVKIAKDNFSPHNNSPVEILDIGTGCGCIAISLAKSLPLAAVDATDKSPEALRVAKENAALNNVRVSFSQSDLFPDSELPITSYDIIVTNPPYIPTQEISKLQPEVQNEPCLALDGGVDGLDFYRRIARESGGYLLPQGFLIMEIGFGQKEAVKNIFEETTGYKIIEVVKDYSGIDRVIVARNN